MTSTPPEALRIELSRLRDRGLSFRQAWPPALSAALRDLSPSSAIQWRTIFQEQRNHWMLAYSRHTFPATPAPMFLTAPDHEPRRERIVVS